MNRNECLTWLAILLMAIFFVAGFMLGRTQVKPSGTTVITRVDTLTVRDTVTEVKPVPVAVYKTDTIRIKESDIIYESVHDTIYVSVMREVKRYETDNYSVSISGYKPSLDSISVYPETKIITIEKEKTMRSRVGIGVDLGYGVGRYGPTPYIGLGLHYNLISF